MLMIKDEVSDNGVKDLTSNESSVLARRHRLHLKYAEAVALYADSNIPVKVIADKLGLGRKALSAYLQRHWRELMLRRHGIDSGTADPKTVKVISAGGQSRVAHEKYKYAVMACDMIEYIDLNISQIARKFGLYGTALSNFMRVHYNDILVNREKVRRELGIGDSLHRGAEKTCTMQYAEAVSLYENTEMTLGEIAVRCGVSKSGLMQHLRFYHRDVLAAKRNVRREAQAKATKCMGDLNGNGRRHVPSPDTVRKYADALVLYRDTSLTVKAIVEKTGVPKEGFRSYLNKWHRDLVVERSGLDPREDSAVNLRTSRKRMKTVAAKYAPAIDSLRQCPRPVSQVAREFGHNPDVFRQYLHKHEPELTKLRIEKGKL